ncbi:hypothetical protein I6N95_25875 [Vagococcus sp. BWB3-3]|uniref:DUF3021 family protein n=1 Tax=Vagococcus allomyrinae TaxID=2794353 RepID=A0A940SYG5_9ENTE|nr:hypothetical protein [Vagococcus allomyrinae]MBP1044441.1 hypothetical protein [Vagococcus allomyrinae]
MLNFLIKVWNAYLDSVALALIGIVAYFIINGHSDSNVPLIVLLEIFVVFLLASVVQNTLLNQDKEYENKEVVLRGIIFFVFICSLVLFVSMGLNHLTKPLEILTAIGLAAAFYSMQFAFVYFTSYREARKLMRAIENYQEEQKK